VSSYLYICLKIVVYNLIVKQYSANHFIFYALNLYIFLKFLPFDALIVDFHASIKYFLLLIHLFLVINLKWIEVDLHKFNFFSGI